MGDVRDKIAANIKKYCELKNIKQKELANALGVIPSAVSNWINGKNSIDIEKLAELCKYLEISLNDIYSFDGEDESELSIDAIKVAHAFDKSNAHIQEIVLTALGLANVIDDDEDDSNAVLKNA